MGCWKEVGGGLFLVPPFSFFFFSFSSSNSSHNSCASLLFIFFYSPPLYLLYSSSLLVHQQPARQAGMGDASKQTLTLRGEDHTLANALRFMLTKNPVVEFAGYSVPHPSEEEVNVRIQTNGDKTALAVYKDALADTAKASQLVRKKFRLQVDAFKQQQNAMEED